MEAEAAKIQELEPSSPQVKDIDSTISEEAPAVRFMLGPDLFVGFDLGDLASSIADFAAGVIDAPRRALDRLPRLGTEFFNALTGRSEIEPEPSDKRFTDPA